MARFHFILVGIDSLSWDPWVSYMMQSIRGVFGDGGPGYQSFATDSAGIWQSLFQKSSGLQEFDILDPDGAYSVDGRGLTVTNARDESFSWQPASAWSNARLFYLAKPSGGTMRCATGATPTSAAVLIETSASARALVHIDIPIGMGVDGRTVRCGAINGDVTIFGALFTRGSGGLIYGYAAKPSRLLWYVARQDRAIQQQWFASLRPTTYLLNGGVNDRLTRTPEQHAQDLEIVNQNIKIGSPGTSVWVVQSNEPGDAANLRAAFQDFVSVKRDFTNRSGARYMDIRAAFGTYEQAVARGYMRDTAHPNDVGSRLIASYTAGQLGLRTDLPDPGPTPYP